MEGGISSVETIRTLNRKTIFMEIKRSNVSLQRAVLLILGIIVRTRSYICFV